MDRLRFVAILGLTGMVLCVAIIGFAVMGPPHADRSGSEGQVAVEPDSARYGIMGVIRGPEPGGATVTVQGPSFDMTMTGDDGLFSIDGLEQGTYTVSVAREGTFFSPGSVEVPVPSQAAEKIVFEIVPPPTRVRENGEPLKPALSWTYWMRLRGPTSQISYAVPAPPPPAPTPVPYPVPSGPHGSRSPAAPRHPVLPSKARTMIRELMLASLADPDARTRGEAALALGRLGLADSKIFDALSAALKDANPFVRANVMLSLGMLKDPRSAPELLRIAGDENLSDADRCNAAVAAGLCGGEVAVQTLTRLANYKTRKFLRAAMLMGAAATGSEQSTFTLLTFHLGNFETEVRAAAACCLAFRGVREAEMGQGRRRRSLDLADLLSKRGLSKETPTEVRRALPAALAAFKPTVEDVKALCQMIRLERDTATVANCAVALGMAAGRTEDPVSRAVALDLLKVATMDWSQPQLSAHAALGLGYFSPDEAGEFLLSVFDGNSHPDVRAAAAYSLGELGYAPALRSLCLEVERPRSGGDARGLALIALGKIGDQEGLAYMRAVLRDVNVPYIRWCATLGLAEGLDEGGFATMVELASNRNRIVRDGAYRGIALYRDDRAVRLLTERFAREDKAELRALILHLLGEAAADPERPLVRLSRAFSPDLLFGLGEAGMILYTKR